MTFTDLPRDLPAPQDDGACAHLVGLHLPELRLPSTQGGTVDFGRLPEGRTILFAYPMTGRPGVALPDGWDAIPGARGCTPQNCAFRDLHREFGARSAHVMAVSTQSPAYQAEMAGRLHLPYPVLSDERLELTKSLRLPTFEAEGARLLRRLTLIVRGGTIEHVFYPVFPPDQSAQQVLDWLDRADMAQADNIT